MILTLSHMALDQLSENRATPNVKGKVNQKVDPTPSTDSTPTSPSCISTRLLAILKPRFRTH